MTGLLTLASLFNSVLFYFVFDEKLGLVHITGMVVMLTGVVFLGLESGKGNEDSLNVGGTDDASMKNGFIALMYGVAAPAFFTIKAYSIRKYPNYRTWDLAIDSLLFEYLCYVLMYIIWIRMAGFNMTDFIYGQIVGILFLLGKLWLTLAYADGLGGPVNTLMCC